MHRDGNETGPHALELGIGGSGHISGGSRAGSPGERALAARPLASSGLVAAGLLERR